jgi:hypothetical protein
MEDEISNRSSDLENSQAEFKSRVDLKNREIILEIGKWVIGGFIIIGTVSIISFIVINPYINNKIALEDRQMSLAENQLELQKLQAIEQLQMQRYQINQNFTLRTIEIIAKSPILDKLDAESNSNPSTFESALINLIDKIHVNIPVNVTKNRSENMSPVH